MKRTALFFFSLALAVGPAIAADDSDTGFDLDLENLDFRPRDPRTEARLARWNDDPMARVAMHMATEQARMLGGNQPGAGRPSAMVISVKFRQGLAAALTVASSVSGIELYERRIAVITWPWAENDDKPAMPLDEQITVMLGDRLER